jgi:hypothetical protein
VAAFDVGGLLTAPARSRRLLGLHSPLVGREAKLAILTGALAGLCEGHGGIVALLGEAGKDTEIPCSRMNLAPGVAIRTTRFER